MAHKATLPAKLTNHRGDWKFLRLATIVCGSNPTLIKSSMSNSFAAMNLLHQAALVIAVSLCVSPLHGAASPLIDVEAGKYDYDIRCVGCHGTEPSYIRRGASRQELTGRRAGTIAHGGGTSPFEGISLPNLAAYLSSTDTNRFSLTGVVVDAQGAGTPGVLVTISSSYLQYVSRQAVTDTDGGYRFEGLPAGDHQMTVTAAQRNFNPPMVELKTIRSVNSGSALFVAYGVNELPPLAPPPARIIRVRPGGDDQASGRAWAAAKHTITAALSDCPDGGEVWVAEGIYHEAVSVRDHQLIGGFAGTETSRTQRDWHTHASIIDADPAYLAEIGFPPSTAVTLSSAPESHATCDGMTIQNGLGDTGGGIHVDPGTTAEIDHCIIRSNTSVSIGGGIFCDQSSIVRLTHNIVENNRSESGGGIYCAFDVTADLTGNLFAGNSALYSGALLADGMIARMVNNTFVQNTSDDGTAVITQWDGSGTNANNIVAFNSAGIDSSGTDANWNHNTVFGNTNFNWNNLAPGSTDIQSDPRFRNLDQRDFHLRPDSPCRDAGSDTYVESTEADLDTLPRKSRRHVDIGAYELPPPSLFTRLDTDGLHLNWPGDETGFILEQTSDTLSPNWQTSPPPSLLGGTWSVLVPPGEHHTFYRLRQQF